MSATIDTEDTELPVLPGERDARCPFNPPPAGALAREAHWTRPILVAEVTFTEWTGEGRVRHPSFVGLRDDKPATSVVREPPSTRRS